jgi:hypothetical protein
LTDKVKAQNILQSCVAVCITSFCVGWDKTASLKCIGGESRYGKQGEMSRFARHDRELFCCGPAAGAHLVLTGTNKRKVDRAQAGGKRAVVSLVNNVRGEWLTQALRLQIGEGVIAKLRSVDSIRARVWLL